MYMYICIRVYIHIGRSVGRSVLTKNVEKSLNNVEMLVNTGARS